MLSPVPSGGLEPALSRQQSICIQSIVVLREKPRLPIYLLSKNIGNIIYAFDVDWPSTYLEMFA